MLDRVTELAVLEGGRHEIRALPWGPLSRSPRDGTFGGAVGIVIRYTAHSVWTGDGGISLKTCLKHGF
jgi:hypothetical protein